VNLVGINFSDIVITW